MINNFINLSDHLEKKIRPFRAGMSNWFIIRIPDVALALPDIHTQCEDLVVAVDSAGIKVTNRGEWMRGMWKIHRGWIKAHIIEDVMRTALLGVEIINDQVSDGYVFLILLDRHRKFQEPTFYPSSCGRGI